MADLTGKDVGRYHVIERLGQGGMAEVYKAYDTRLEREVALKVIRKDVIGSAFHEAMMKRFEREAKALARLSHPNIVQVHDFGSYKGAPYLVMEYLSGGVLNLKVHGILAYAEAARLLAPVARALECAHEEGILHRDVKPANILMTRQGQPKLSDFGIAKLLDMEGSTQLTGTNMGIGTPEYMAPEQWMGKPVAQTDIYALGVVLYELVTGKRPYTADTPLAVMHKQMTDPLPRARLYNPDLPEMVEQVLFKALAKDPQDRYASMGEFAAMLERLALGQAETPVTQPVEPAAVDQTQQAAVGEKKPQRYLPPAPVVIPTQPTPQPQRVPVAHSRVVEPIGELGSKAWKQTAGGVLVLGLLVMAVILIWTSQFSVETQARRTATAAAQAVEQTAGGATVLAALWTETPSVTPIPSRTQPPAVTYTPSHTPTPQYTPQAGDIQVSAKDGMVMVWVPEGQFSMGTSDEQITQLLSKYSNWQRDWFTGEQPVLTVYLDGYWMDRTEVTNTMYALCVAAGACQNQATYANASQKQDHPVEGIDWLNAKTYCEWAGRSLPSEAQWEKAARSTDGRTYPWGEGIDCDKANYSGCSKGDTTAVGNYPSGASPYGIMDMAGNVWEWVADWYAEIYFSISPASNPQGPDTGYLRGLRGGSWYDDGNLMRSAFRGRGNPDYRGDSIGFRCSRSQ